MCLSGQLALGYNYSSTVLWCTNFHSTNCFHFQNSLQCMNAFLRCKGMSITYQVPDIVTWQDLHCGCRLDWPHLPSNANVNNLYNCSRAAPRCSVDRWRYQTSVWTCYQGSRHFMIFWHASQRSGLRALDDSMHSMYVYDAIATQELPNSVAWLNS